MHSEPAIENRATSGGRRRKRGNGSDEGPVFVDASGRRSKLLRRIGILVGVLCLGYAVVLGLAFMGIGASSSSSLLPFGSGQAGPGGSGTGPGGLGRQGDVGYRVGGRPSGAPTALPSGTPSPSVTASASAAD
ncbi:hypothetical protein [Streptomyces sp. MBT33]|uniref:hypothetical protein n=1 Tax=Streptomyces sp. MBT33 TaxID=1488363 RepID=UPI00190B2060|nr:hypothetical protein [Streptomyces sp. MBT33]MBK3643070.1 hypothetical protein [Streptomyces sp. MBT33]